jgi:opacity protein-like surface antigen
MFKKITIAATLSMLACSAFAADEPKWYGGADVGVGKLRYHSDGGTSVGAFLGYRISDTFAVEAGARRLGDFDAGSEYTTKVDQYSISGLASVPLGTGLKLYGRLGINHVNFNTQYGGGGSPRKSHDLGALYGAGLSYDFTPTVSGRIEVQKPTSDTTSISSGVSFKF